MEEELKPELQETLRTLRAERGSCPPVDRLIEYEELQAGERSSHALHSHVQVCSRCQLILLHLSKPVDFKERYRWILPVAAALLLVVLAPYLYRDYLSQKPVDETIRGGEIQPISPIGPIREIQELRWQSPVQVPRYRISIYRGATLLWSSSVSSLRAAFPSDLNLEPNVDYLWQVEALDDEGVVRMKSPQQVFSLKK